MQPVKPYPQSELFDRIGCVLAFEYEAAPRIDKSDDEQLELIRVLLSEAGVIVNLRNQARGVIRQGIG